MRKGVWKAKDEEEISNQVAGELASAASRDNVVLA